MKNIFITGASGTIGKAFIRKYYEEYNFFCYSRNEKLQVALKREFPKVEIFLGSVDDLTTLDNCISKLEIDYFIHAAALKHVDTAEKQPSLAINVNLIGTLNVLEVCRKYGIKKVIGISTDKACSPNNVYGMTKFMMEKVFEEFHSKDFKTACCRFGNVAWSNGSVLPYWLNLKAERKSLGLTHPDMTRLIFTANEAAELINQSINLVDLDKPFFILSRKMKSCKMKDLAELISSETHNIGLRPGEVMFEDLISEKEISNAFEILNDKYLIISKDHNFFPNMKRLNSPVNSNTAILMSKEEMVFILDDVKNHLTSFENVKFNY